MNRTIRQFLDSTKSLTDFVSLVDHAINKLHHKDLQDDFSPRHNIPSLRHADILNPYYQHVASLFTRRIYTKKVSHEIKLIHAYTVRQVDEIDGYINFSIIKFPNGDSEHNVIRRISDSHLTCNCLLFETDGYPCRHIFSVLKFLNITRIPDSLVLARWAVHAKAQFQTRYQSNNEVPQEILELTRFGTLSSDFNQVAYYATKVEDFYQQTRTELANLCLKFKSLMEREPPLVQEESIDEINPFEVLKDPIVVRNKGTARRPQVGPSAQENWVWKD
ncbi:protein FAR1-RELATED SEQUENCE 9-like [Morus notabilis]|uniref:protein FAR1-RELATED SEQUENCE 9-like n=1 Tax=Morus notabilis TaxID=981085 RepID=UPI000CED0B48|nr:protein FAR1-RELATED SEQUENCE 9-like [Morus notabilis]